MNGKGELCFIDRIVIYREDGRWVAHSIETDQIGVDEEMIVAVADLIKTVYHLLEIAEKDKTIVIKRKAPKEIIDKEKKSIILSDDIFNIACEMAMGKWSQNAVDIKLTPKKVTQNYSVNAQLQECYC